MSSCEPAGFSVATRARNEEPKATVQASWEGRVLPCQFRQYKQYHAGSDRYPGRSPCRACVESIPRPLPRTPPASLSRKCEGSKGCRIARLTLHHRKAPQEPWAVTLVTLAPPWQASTRLRLRAAERRSTARHLPPRTSKPVPDGTELNHNMTRIVTGNTGLRARDNDEDDAVDGDCSLHMTTLLTAEGRL